MATRTAYGISRLATSVLVGTAIVAALFAGCARSSHPPTEPAAAAAPPAPPPAPAPPEAEAIRKKVEDHARKTGRAAGKHGRVKDEVKVRPDANGGAVVEQRGEASYYGKGFHGRKTASGQRFDANAHTAAHPTLPLGTKATVKNLETGKSVDVTITDRGPHANGRDIDLSEGAAKDVGLDKKDGTAPVEIEAKVTPAPGAPQR